MSNPRYNPNIKYPVAVPWHDLSPEQQASAQEKDWAYSSIDGVPYWWLIDAEGNVIEHVPRDKAIAKYFGKSRRVKLERVRLVKPEPKRRK